MDKYITYRNHIDNYYKQKEFNDFITSEFKRIINKIKGSKLMGISIPEDIDYNCNQVTKMVVVSAYYAGACNDYNL